MFHFHFSITFFHLPIVEPQPMKQNLSEQEEHEERQTLLRMMAILPPQKIG